MIYSNDPTKREIRRRTGRTGYFDADWHGFDGDVVDTITGKIDNFTALMEKKTDTWATMSKAQLNERVTKFQDFGLENMREGYIAKRMNEANLMRESAVEEGFVGAPNSRVTNLGQAQANRDRRIQGYLRAKQKLKQAEELGGEQQASYRYNLTGHELLNPVIDDYYNDFDSMIEERKQAYAKAYGRESFDDFEEGFGMFGTKMEMQSVGQGDWTDQLGRAVRIQDDWNPEYAEQLGYTQTYVDEEVEVADYSAVGQQDVMNMILSDMIGMSYDDLTYASTAELGFTREIRQGFLVGMDTDLVTNMGEEGIEGLREVFGNYFFMAAEGADRASQEEDAFRIASAKKAEADFAKSQRMLSDKKKESTAEAMTEINSSIRAAEQEYEQSKSQLLGGGTPRQRKAQAVTFKDARPQ